MSLMQHSWDSAMRQEALQQLLQRLLRRGPAVAVANKVQHVSCCCCCCCSSWQRAAYALLLLQAPTKSNHAMRWALQLL